MARILGIDYGTKRVGVAISDEIGMLAMPVEVLDVADMGHAANQVSVVARERKVARVIVGLPLNMNGSAGPAAELARDFAKRLAQKTGLPVELYDERLTTCEAEKALLEGDVSRKKRRQVRDMLSAQLILQSYLDSHAPGYDPASQED